MVATLTGAVVALALAALFQWREWGKKRWNWGCRLGALLILSAGYGLNTALGGALRRFVDWAFGWLGEGVAALGSALANATNTEIPTAALGEVTATAGPWLLAVVLALILLASIFPDRWFPDELDWPIAWAGGLYVPVMVSGIPGQGGLSLGDIVGWLGDVGGNIVRFFF